MIRITTCQRKGTMEGKTEMEDRVSAGANVLSSGCHCMISDEGGIYAVFDGVGGMRGSAYAATSAAISMADLRPPYGKEELRGALESVHRDLVDYSSTATTATGVAIQGDRAIMFHVGNCRLYGLFGGYLRQMTVDQTRYEELLSCGVPPEEIPESAKCVINACIGAKDEYSQSIVYEDISTQYAGCEKLVLTSDGIHDHVSAEELEAAVREPATWGSLEGLLDLAAQHGSADDLSVMVIEKMTE